ncbi:MAG TPA: sigma-54 dependent transcriptional regulator [Terriglobia bacterium]|nr:sigma-54 dependent transcriptional regulator [Terriglobia bacterium]
MPRILIVDDEPGIRQSLKGVFEDEGFTTEAVASGEECLRKIEANSYDLVLLDIWLPGADGLETLRRLREKSPDTRVIMISGHATIATAVSATKLGAYDFIEKPLSLEHTLLIARNALSHRRLERTNDLLRHELEDRFHIVGESIPTKALRKQIAIVAPTNSRVLIYGESGTGKELVSRNIHFLSSRANAPFIEVNCAAIPEELIESELFGHTKGSFTSASESKKGKFELADGGTIFLDEVGDMTLKTQAKVLRAVEEQSFQPIGAPAAVRVDVRVITATNKNLQNEIASGRFREDLFYRLNVIPFFVPPLRERREDIPVLARYFMRVFSAEHGRPAKDFGSDALDMLVDYSWPGNVRELRNEIERLVIMVPDAVIQAPDLSLPNGHATSRASTLHEARAQYEREFILSKLKENNWNITQTARLLGLERSYLYRKMKIYGIEK